jgi:hypothetical protein
MKKIALLNQLINKVTDITELCFDKAADGDYEAVNELIETRGTVLEIISKVQVKIEEDRLYYLDNSIDVINIHNQLNQLVSYITELDDKLVLILNEERERTKNQIAKTFQNKENFKGYNHKTVK